MRPITDRVKESLFNLIGPDIEGARFLDLFAGTGSVGIEALSRGAAKVRFIDKDRRAIETVRQNLAITGLQDNAQVLRSDAFAYLNRAQPEPFHYIYIAPPQYRELWSRALIALDRHPGWLADDAWVIVQIHPREYQALALQAVTQFDLRRYGSTQLVFYERATSETGAV